VQEDTSHQEWRLDYSGECHGIPTPIKSTVADTVLRDGGKSWIVNAVFTPLGQ